MPISDARDNLAEVVNRAAYSGEPTYITRRGRRLAVVVSAAQLEADEMRNRQQGVYEACRKMWLGVKDADEATKAAVRSSIDQIIEVTEDGADLVVLASYLQDPASGTDAVPWEQVKSELGL